jgi:ABC-type multidrug transport system fused ATPase/permease subunit
MAVDAQRFMDLTSYLHLLWSAPLQIALSLFFLYRLMHLASLAGLGVMILMIPLNGYIAKKIRNFQKRLMKHKDHRIKLMTEILNGIKVLKLYAWERPFGGFVTDVRNEELKVLKSASYFGAASSFSWSVAPFLVSLVTFVTYTVMGNTLTAEKAFVSLSLFNLLRFPLAMLPMLITSLVEATVSLKRVRNFLLLEEMDPHNVSKDPAALQRSVSDGVVPALMIEHGKFSWGATSLPQPGDGKSENNNGKTGKKGGMSEKSPLLSGELPTGQPQAASFDVFLSDINLRAAPSSLVGVVGRVGAGKSSLISAILGDMVKLHGSVIVPGSVAYVPQVAWIRNLTVRENILFGREYNEARYRRVLHACALEPDLEQLPGGDETEIGEKGINLSGGQKARISLARAVYQDTDIYLLDDPLSAVDSHVGEHLFRMVLGPQGLLRDKVRILVTNALHVLPQCDQIVVMRGGRITENGTYETLNRAGAEFTRLIADFSDNNNSANASTTDLQGLAEDPAKTQSAVSRQASLDQGGMLDKNDPAHDKNKAAAGGPTAAPAATSTSAVASTTANGAPSVATANTSLIAREATNTGNVKWSIYVSYFRALSYRVVFTLAFLYIAAYGANVGSNVWLSEWSAADERHASDKDAHMYSLAEYLGVYAALGLGNSIGLFFISLLLAYGSVRASTRMHESMLTRIVRAPMSFFDTTPLGRIVNRFSKDIYVIDETIPSSLRSFMSTFMQVVSIVVVISYSTPIFMAAILPMGILYYLIQRFYVATSRQLKRLESVSRSPIYAHFGETLGGVSSIRAYGREREFIKENEDRVNFNLQAYYPGICANRWLALRLEFLGNCIIFFAALFSVIDRKHIHPGTVGLSLSYAMSVTQTLNWMVRMSSQLETDIVAIERVEEYTTTDVEKPAVEGHRPAPEWPLKGEVAFENYGVRYRDGLEMVLQNISANVRGSEKIGIVGRTGAGKSSLTLALFRLLEPATGRIVIDGEDITGMGLEDLRSRLTIMPQDAVLFSGTVRRNLDPFDRAADADLWRALETCHLHAYIKQQPGGLDAEVSENGSNFSVGQRQLMCLARAVLRKTRVLVLDEATAAVDMETDELLQKTIRTEFKECTIFTIAHRLNTIMDSDRIMVLDKGRIVEFDTPQVLLATPSSIFYGMSKAAGLV